jgi:chromosome partitioning protein
MQPHFLALQGVAKLLETVQLVNKRINPKLKVSGIVLTMYDSQTKLTSEVVAELNSFILDALGKPLPWATARIFKSKIRRNIKLAESPSFGQHILDYESSSNGAIDYRALAKEVLTMEDEIVQPVISVTMNHDIDPSKLAAAKVTASVRPQAMPENTEAVA